MEKEFIIRTVLKKVFEDITTDVTDFTYWRGYKTAEVKFKSMKETIGIGINHNFSVIKLFYIDRSHYTENDCRRFKHIIRIGQSKKEKGVYWDIGLVATHLNVPVGAMYFVNYHLQVALMIIQMIYSEELNIFTHST